MHFYFDRSYIGELLIQLQTFAIYFIPNNLQMLQLVYFFPFPGASMLSAASLAFFSRRPLYRLSAREIRKVW